MKKITAIILITALILCMAGCVGEPLESEESTPCKVLVNYGSCFACVFQDVETGVWYVSTSEGVTPRLNADGTLYVSEVE